MSCFSVINFADKPTEVKLGIYVNSFYSISEQTMVGIWCSCIGKLVYTCVYVKLAATAYLIHNSLNCRSTRHIEINAIVR